MYLPSKLFRLKDIILSRDIFDHNVKIEEVNPELRGVIKFTKRFSSIIINIHININIEVLEVNT